jgi:hypothetical protein
MSAGIWSPGLIFCQLPKRIVPGTYRYLLIVHLALGRAGRLVLRPMLHLAVDLVPALVLVRVLDLVLVLAPPQCWSQCSSQCSYFHCKTGGRTEAETKDFTSHTVLLVGEGEGDKGGRVEILVRAGERV